MPVLTRREFSAASVAFGLLGGSSCATVRDTPVEPELLDDGDLQELLRSRVDTSRRTVGLAVGIVTPGERRTFVHGRLSKSDSRAPRGDTVFEIASVTKVFTALLLADMAERGELGLNDPVEKHLPSGVSVPERGGRKISLLELATHTSGLPYWPGNLAEPGQSGADEALEHYTFDDFHEFLSGHVLVRDIGAQWEYSAVGYTVLGEALAHRSGMEFEALVRARITATLGMRDTGVRWKPTSRLRAATGHDAALNPVPERRAPLLVASGGLHSTVDDMMRLLTALVDAKPSRLRAAASLSLAHHRRADAIDSEQAIGWLIRQGNGGEIAVALGGGFGFASAIAIDPLRGAAVVVLSNSIDPVADIATRVLRPGVATASTSVDVATEIQLDPALFERYVGRYRSEAGLAFDVVQEQGSLAIRFPGAVPKLRARSATEFFTDGGAEITFHLDASGRANGLDLRAPSIPRLSAVRTELEP